MTIDPRNAIWNEAYDLQYRVSYASMLKTALLARWVWLDSITKIAVAIASGGAALAGLVFWKNSDYTFLWPMFTSTSALLAIVSKQLNVAETLKTHATSVAALDNLDTEIGSMILRKYTDCTQPHVRIIMIKENDPRRKFDPPNPIPPPPKRPT